MAQTPNLNLYYNFPGSLPHQSFVEQLSSNMQTIDLAFASLSSKVSDKAETSTFTATIPSSGWSGSSAPYTIDLSVSGIRPTDNPIVDLLVSNIYETAELEQENWVNIYRMTTSSDIVTAYAKEIPSVDLNIQLKVVR